ISKSRGHANGASGDRRRAELWSRRELREFCACGNPPAMPRIAKRELLLQAEDPAMRGNRLVDQPAAAQLSCVTASAPRICCTTCEVNSWVPTKRHPASAKSAVRSPLRQTLPSEISINDAAPSRPKLSRKSMARERI